MQIRVALLIVVFVLSVLSVGDNIWSVSKGEPISFDKFMGLPISIIALLGAGKEKKKRRKDKRERKRAKPFRLMPSFDSGLYGGLIGGAIAGLIIGVMYYVDFMNAGWGIIPHIFIYASLVGTLFGASIQLIILCFRHLVTERRYSSLIFNEVSGGILGGAIAGIPAGAFGGWFFGLRPIPFIDIGLLVTGSLLGAICIVLGTLLYDYEGRWQNVTRALIVSAVVSAFAAVPGIVMLQFLRIDVRFFSWDTTALLVTEGGAIIGLVIGIVLGLQVGCTLRLYRFWEVMTKTVGH